MFKALRTSYSLSNRKISKITVVHVLKVEPHRQPVTAKF